MALILDGTTGIVANNIADYAISTAKLANSAVTTAKMGYAGAVLQIVNTAWTTQDQSTTSTSFVDTGLSASITPASTSSKILVLVSLSYEYYYASSRGLFGYKLMRGATVLHQSGTNSIGIAAGITTADHRGKLTYQFYDSPSTTSSTTYKLQIAVENGSLNMNPSNNQSAITLFEIAG